MLHAHKTILHNGGASARPRGVSLVLGVVLTAWLGHGCEILGSVEHRTLAVCSPGEARCVADNGREVCKDDGSGWAAAPCDAAAPLCAGAGSCVQCVVEGSMGEEDRCTVEHCVDGEIVVDANVDPSAPCEIAEGEGELFTCARTRDGIVRCWGDNTRGQLGLGAADMSPHLKPAPVAGLPAARALSVGFLHACAILRDGTLRCWGLNNYGQVSGMSPGPDVPAPIEVPLPQRARHVDVGGDMTCAVLEDATVRCWGRNQAGQLGDGTTTDHPVPTKVLDPESPTGALEGAVALALTQFMACALLTGGKVKCWGSLPDGKPPSAQVTFFSGAVQISGGPDHVCARTSVGEVACWGFNEFGECGDAATVGDLTPLPAIVPKLVGVTDVGAGLRHSCAAIPSGVVCWGSDLIGQLGDASGCVEFMNPECESAQSVAPVAVIGIAGAVTDLVTSWQHSCAIVGSEVFCWGRNDTGQLGDGTTKNADRAVKVLW